MKIFSTINYKKWNLIRVSTFAFLLGIGILFCSNTVYAEMDRVNDQADLLTTSEEESLRQNIQNIADQYQFDVVIYLTTENIQSTVTAAADDYYDYNGFGYGENYDGILFYVNMTSREYWISTTGYGMIAFTDYGTDLIGEACAYSLSNGDYAGAMNSFVGLTSEFLIEANEQMPYDTNHLYGESTDNDTIETEANTGVQVNNSNGQTTASYSSEEDPENVFTGFVIIGLIIGGVAVFIAVKRMKTAKAQPFAKEYIKNGSFHLSRERDSFLFSNVVRTAIPKQSSGGGTSSHTGSSGRSHGGSGGHF